MGNGDDDEDYIPGPNDQGDGFGGLPTPPPAEVLMGELPPIGPLRGYYIEAVNPVTGVITTHHFNGHTFVVAGESVLIYEYINEPTGPMTRFRGGVRNWITFTEGLPTQGGVQ